MEIVIGLLAVGAFAYGIYYFMKNKRVKNTAKGSSSGSKNSKIDKNNRKRE